MKKRRKLTKEEIEKALDDEFDTAIYRMYTKTGVDMRMSVAKFYYTYNHKKIACFVAYIFLLFVDTIDVIVAIKEKYSRKNKDNDND